MMDKSLQDEKLEMSSLSPESHATPGMPSSTLPSTPSSTLPEGGLHGWLTVFGGAICLFLSFGFINAFSVFEVQYQIILTSNSSPSDIAWIGSFQLFTVCSSTLIIGQLFDRYGPRPLLAFVTILYPFSCMMNSLATTYWQIFICQGILQGISIALTYATSISCIPQWFHKRRALAASIVVAGSSLGGVLWPIIILHLLNEVGYAWTWRVVGFMSLVLLIIATLTVSRRNETSWSRLVQITHQKSGQSFSPDQQAKKPFLYLDAFQSRAYCLLCAANIFSYLGLFYTFFYLSSWSAYYGLPQNLQFYSISILNAASTFGRIIPGILADRYGVLNTIFFCTLSSVVVVLCSMAVSDSTGVLIIGGFYGFTSGGLISLIVPCIAKSIEDISRMGTALGQLSAICAIPALLGPPIAGFIVNRDGDPDWHGGQGYSAACLLCTALFLGACRLSISTKLSARV